MKFFSLFVLFFLLTNLSFAREIYRWEISGNLEGQFRHSKNNPEAKEDLQQNWDEENFSLLYGNLSGKFKMGNNLWETNLFARYSQSPLYDPEPNIFGNSDPYLATRIFAFPNRLVARDMFKMQHTNQEGDHQTDAVLNKLYYEHQFSGNRFMLGRMYVNYGLGEIFNPINPFNQPTGLSSISQIAQGNDGVSLTIFATQNHNIQFLLLGDKSIYNYEGKIDTTVWMHGEWQATDELQVDYVLGEDQNRRKIGGQLSYRFSEAMVFIQGLYQSENIEDVPSNDLVDALLGIDQQLTALWHVRFEGGYQKENKYVTIQSTERFLPTEYFLALANIYEIHPLFKISGTIVNDVKSGFVYLIGKGTWDLGHGIELDLFGYVPAAKGDDTDNVAQKLVTTDIGLSLRAFF